MDLLEAKEKKYGSTITSRHPWEQARLSFIKKKMIAYSDLKKGSVVIDIGCGDVFVSESLANLFPEVWFYAVDTAFTDDLISNYKTKMHVKNLILYKNIEEVVIDVNTKVNTVLLNDVIEHIQDDEKFLKELLQRNCFDAKTLFLITVPAYQSLFCSHDIVLGHYRRYTNTSLKKVLKKSGLITFSLGYFFTSLLLLRIIKVIGEKIFSTTKLKSSTGLSEWEGSELISWFLKTVLLMDIHLVKLFNKIGIKLPGLSNYALCRRSV